MEQSNDAAALFKKQTLRFSSTVHFLQGIVIKSPHPTANYLGLPPGSAMYCVDLGKLLNLSVLCFLMGKIQVIITYWYQVFAGKFKCGSICKTPTTP
jgi:hypothetical protein